MFTTRRGLLIGAALVAAAGCTESPAKIIVTDSDLTAALKSARTLADAAEALGFTDIATDHRTHAETLERLLKPNVVAATEPESAIGDVEALAEAETAGSREATESCLTTESGYAVLFGEIAASRAAHAAVLA
ncbi:hypothetical protein GCM10027447_10010 [Glycomyces halotolerans]